MKTALTNLILTTLVTISLASAGDCFAQTGELKPPGLREGNRWVVPVPKSGKPAIPRAFASLKSAFFEGHPDVPVAIAPQINHWELKFKGEAPADKIVLEFDSFPALAAELKPIQQLGDSTLTLPCSLGTTHGQKLRFEPQPHKNTIGFWTKKTDSVTWEVEITKPGKFNIGILQGAARNGGGTARISVGSDAQVLDSVEYQVNVTGHFQNFVWQPAGTIEIPKAGTYTIKIEAVEISKVALMDVRQLHLSPVPKGMKN